MIIICDTYDKSSSYPTCYPVPIFLKFDPFLKKLTLAKTFININGTLILTNLKKGGETPYGNCK